MRFLEFIRLHRLFLTMVLASYLFWVVIFGFTGGKPNDSYTDQLSGETVKLAGVYNTERTNPDMPFFVGFDDLKKYGVSSDDRRYILDVLTNYTLYDLKLKSAKVSYVNKSFKNTLGKGTADDYQFRIGVNDTNIHTVNVSSDIVKKTISISLTNADGKKVFSKDFILYSL